MSERRRVEVEVFGGQIVQRIALETIENKVIIVTNEEAADSERECRRPNGVGYDIDKVFFLSE